MGNSAPMAKSAISADEAFLPEELPFYKKGMEFFHLQLVHLNVNIFILDHVLSFPYYLFTDPDESLFFRMVFENFFYASLLIITRLAADQGPDLFTLPRFRNRIRDAVKPEYRRQLDQSLRSARFSATTRSVLHRATKLRNERVAHVLEEVALGQGEGTRIVYGELKSLRDQLNQLLDALSFNTYYMMLPLQYSPDVSHPGGTGRRPDIERVLDSVARESLLLNLPERNPVAWSSRKQKMPANDLEILNSYRVKFGLPRV